MDVEHLNNGPFPAQGFSDQIDARFREERNSCGAEVEGVTSSAAASDYKYMASILVSEVSS